MRMFLKTIAAVIASLFCPVSAAKCINEAATVDDVNAGRILHTDDS